MFESKCLILRKFTEKAIIDRLLKAAVSNNGATAEKLLNLKKNYMAAFQNSIKKLLPSSSELKVNHEFCASKVLENFKERATYESYTSHMIFWFPVLKSFSMWNYTKKISLSPNFSITILIKIPQVGC